MSSFCAHRWAVRSFCSILLLLATSTQAMTVKTIQWEGLKRVPSNTLEAILPLKLGADFDISASSDLIKVLYKTGYFKHVEILEGKNGALIIKVQELPVIGHIDWIGTSVVTSDILDSLVSKYQLNVGDTWNEHKWSLLSKELKALYESEGYYRMKVTPVLHKIQNGGVAAELKVVEGETTEVKAVYFKGQHAFSTNDLSGVISLQTKSILTWITGSYVFSQKRLAQSYQELAEYYLNHGYAQVRLGEPDVIFSKDKSSATVTFNIDEGKVFRIGDVKINNQSHEKLTTLKSVHLPLFKGDLFTKNDVLLAKKAIEDALMAQGYAQVQVGLDVKPMSRGRIQIIFNVVEGKPILVRYINFFGNSHTNDEVLRRETRQMESAYYSQPLLEETQRRLSNLGYIKEAIPRMVPVEGQPDKVDLAVQVKEGSSATANIQFGYSTRDKLLFGMNVNEKNLFGTGKKLSVNFDRNAVSSTYSLGFGDPFYGPNGLSRSMNVYTTKHNPGTKVNIASYTARSTGLGFNFGIPMSDYSGYALGLQLSSEKLSEPGANAAQNIKDFVTAYGTKYDQSILSVGWNYSRLDRSIYPTQGRYLGLHGEVGLPVGSKSLEFYKTSLSTEAYVPLDQRHEWVLDFQAHVAAGGGFGRMRDDGLPFFKHYYAGGIGSVRGYQGNSLGPNDKADGTGNAIGGSVLMTFSANMIFPNPFDSEMARTALFVDAGNVFDKKLELGDLRYSAGVALQLRTPVAPLVFAFAVPLNAKDYDKKQTFDFTISTGL